MSGERGRRSGALVSRSIGSPMLVLALALSLVACDGGIFGTGDGDGSGLATSPGGNSGPPSLTDGETAGGMEGDVDGGSGGDETGSGENAGATDGEGGGDTGGNADVPGAAFTNTLDVGTADEPRVRLVNASSRGVTLGDAENRPLLAGSVTPGETSVLAALPPDLDELRLRGADTGEGGTALLYRFAPLSLSMSSVTTLVVRDDGGANAEGRGVDAVALETRVAPSDPAQALVRVVLGGMQDDPDGNEPIERAHRLVPAGESPGGVEVAFEPVTFAGDPASGYRDVPAGDYRLVERVGTEDDAGDGPALRSVSLAPGSVHTFVIVDATTVIDVIDGVLPTR